MGQKTHEDKDKEIRELKAKLLAKDDALVEKDNALTIAKDNGEALALEIENMEQPEAGQAVKGQADINGCFTFTPDEYAEHSKQKGLIMGRRPDQKTQCTIEELRALINSEWTPKMIMEKHGLSAEDLKQLVWKLSKRELRGKPIKFSIERDMFSREG